MNKAEQQTQRREQPLAMNGILNVLKPPGMTSSDVVVRVRRKVGGKVGHGGTLDPGAAGVLPILLGKATRLFDHMQLHSKTYMGEFVLGVTTDTLDTSGAWRDSRPVTEEMVQRLPAVMATFVGQVEQVPPQYSALKQGGKKLYQLARKGQEVSVAPRTVTIHACELLGRVDATHFRFRLDCSKGTYVRSLVRDIGEALGCGACLASLLRTRSGDFDIQSATTLTQLAAADAQALQTLLLPVESALLYLPAYTLPPACWRALCDGKPVAAQNPPTGSFRLHCGDTFVGIGSDTEEGVRVRTWLTDARAKSV